MLKLSEVHIDDLVGAVHYKGEWRIFASIMVDWILCYTAYNPDRASIVEENDFRDGVIDVSDENVEQYISYLSQYEIELSEVQIAAKVGKARPLEIVVDFDTKTFVNGFREINLDYYAPKGWKAYEDDPYEYVPKETANLWRVAV